MTALPSSARAIPLTRSQPVPLSGQAYRVAGLLFASIVPALFWMMIAHGVAHVAGFAVTTSALAATGVIIAAFLGYVCAPIMLRAR